MDSSERLPKPLLLCLSHLRWNFVFQRPQHLLTRAARDYRVIYVEEPEQREGIEPGWEFELQQGVTIARPLLPPGLQRATEIFLLEALVGHLLKGERPAIAWYYTPAALEFTRDFKADVTVYDNMDELTLFHGADSRLGMLETEVLARADVVFTGGHSLYEAKSSRHSNIHPVPSSVDTRHFAAARDRNIPDPVDQAAIAGPRIGFFGVVDERMDMDLVDGLAALRPDLSLVMLGPVCKIDPASRPMRPNIHWLGGKSYDELPAYLAHWDAGFMPFAMNEATRFISPTKTPEFLAAGLPVVSTPIRDVIRPYGEKKLVEIAATAAEFAAALDRALACRTDSKWLASVDAQLASSSWDGTWQFMRRQVRELISGANTEAAHA